MKQFFVPRLAAALIVTTALAGCADKPAASGGIALPAGLPAVEVVNGVKVPQILLTRLALGRNLDLTKPDDHAAALKELTDYVLLGQEAERAGYTRDGAFAADIEIARLQALASRTVLMMRDATPIDDSLLKAEYDQQVARVGQYEYDISQLIFKTEDEALKAAGELSAGKTWREVFDTLGKTAQQAKSYSGVKLAQLPEPLAAAVRDTKPGEAMKVPVQTQYGWHLIRVDLATPFNPGSFEQLKEGIRNTLASQLANDRVQKLRSDARIELLTPAPAPAAVEKPVAPAVAPKQG